jgi:dipeptidyl aminopeptidase/acylaminoacyl peptidase
MTKLSHIATLTLQILRPFCRAAAGANLPGRLVTSLIFLLLTAQMCFGQSEVPGPGFDPTPVSLAPSQEFQKRAVTSLDLLQIRRLAGLQISPDGTSIAFVLVQALAATNSYRTGLFVVSTSNKQVITELGSAGPPEFDSSGQVLSVPPQWSPDSKYVTSFLVFNGVRQIARWSKDGGPPQQLTQSAYDIQAYEWAKNGSEIIYRTMAPIDLAAVRASAQMGLVFDGAIRSSRAKPITDLIRERQTRRMEWWKYEIDTNETHRLTGAEIQAQQSVQDFPLNEKDVYLAKRSPDGKAVAYVRRLQRPLDFKYYAWSLNYQDGSGRKQTLVPATTESISDLRWSSTGKRIYFAKASDRLAGLFEVSASGGSVKQISRSLDQLSNFSFDGDEKLVACITESTTRPPNIAIIQLKDGGVSNLTELNPEFQELALSVPTRFDWSNKYGDRAFGYLFKPIDFGSGKTYPLIITTYTAGGFLAGATGDEFPIQVFASHGFLVLAFNAPDRRPANPGDFRTQMLTWYSPLSSLEVIVRRLVREGLVDPERVGLTGLSYGAEITQFAITHSSIFAAAATGGWSGRDPIFYYLTYDGWRRIFKDWVGGAPEGANSRNWKELSPALNVTKLTAPLLVQAAETEYLSGLQFYNALKEHQVPVELIVYPNEGHIKNQPAHKLIVYERNLAWFKFWLLENHKTQKTSWFEKWSERRDKSVRR